MIKTVIIEDEPATARNLRAMLAEADENIEVIATLDEVAGSVEWFQKNENKYDLVLMDIRLSDGLSFDILTQVNIQSPIIFITAYDEYALRAFNTNGIGYILKPFQLDDIEKAIQKFKNITATNARMNMPELGNIAMELKALYKNYRQSFLFHFRDKLLPVAAKDIAWFYSINETCIACSSDGKKYKTDFTLEQLEKELDPAIFFRASRQFIVHRSAITEIDFFFNGRLLVKTQPLAEENILVSKAKVPGFKGWMNR